MAVGNGRVGIETLECRALMSAEPIPLKIVGIPGGEFTPAYAAVSVKNVDYFFAPGAGTLDLWKSNGTAAGTAMVRSFVDPGSTDVDGNGVTDHGSVFAVLNNVVFFTADDGVHGAELWRTDGTSGGTRMVADVDSGAKASSPKDFFPLGHWLYFTADDGVHGRELWRTDGSGGSTMLVADVTPGAGGSTLANLGAAGNTLLFTTAGRSGATSIWRSDDAGTFAFTSVPNIYSKGFGPAGKAAVFAVNDPTAGLELWITSGSADSTKLVKKIKPVPKKPTTKPATPTAPSDWTVLNGHTLFFADATSGKVDGTQLWSTDGTAKGTFQVTNDPKTEDNARFSKMVLAGKQVLFFNGSTLWRSDGSPKGTQSVGSISGGSVTQELPASGHLFVTTTSGDTSTVSRSDTSAAGTARVTDSSGLFITGYLAAVKTSVLFLADDGDTQALYSIPIATPTVSLSTTIDAYPTFIKRGSTGNTLTLNVSNKGTADFAGNLPVQVFAAAPGQTFDRTKLTPWFNGTVAVNVAAKKSATVTVTFNVPRSFATGRYVLVVLLDPNRTIAGEDVSDNLLKTDSKKVNVT